MSDEEKLTPMMRQYRAAKADIPADAILLFRLGDFYEMFFEDAARASAILDLVLTRRQNLPMCGFPYHNLEVQLPRLLAAGVKVAIAEQLEDPKLAKGIVKRAITRIITPGTVLEGSVLTPGRNNFLLALCRKKDDFALASLDITTGEFRVTMLSGTGAVESELNRLGARECAVPVSLLPLLEAEPPLIKVGGGAKMLFTPIEDYLFDPPSAREFLQCHFGVSTLDGFGCKNLPLAVSAAGAVLCYAVENLRQEARHVTKLTVYLTSDVVEIDAASQRNLELVDPMYGNDRSSTLLAVMDRTVTPMGGRLLRDWLLRPLAVRDAILKRLDAVDALLGDVLTMCEIHETLGVVRDLERIVARLNLGNANARDLLMLAASLESLPGIRLLVGNFDTPLMNEIGSAIAPQPELADHIRRAIVDEPPLPLTDGGIIREGYDARLDDFRRAAAEGKDWLADIQKREQERTGIRSLKVRYNSVFGYYIEVSKSNLDLVPDDYVRKQTTTNGERFITPELKELESKILGAEEKSKALEFQLFQALREETLPFTPAIQQTAAQLAVLDVLCSFAECARQRHYVRPRLTDDAALHIRGGRHPVLDITMKTERFVPNDANLDDDLNKMMIITGPNMAGKSTYIRQTALLVLLAQCGSFIPADDACIGLVDRIFTRVGASDDLNRGQSTFMVEMSETANILNHATAKSLVILDEIGRGTSTFDGLSLAWSIAEFLHDEIGCRTQFATHYHELTGLAQTRRGIKNYLVAVREYGDKVIFMRQIVPGGADKSYGIYVAKLAGLPPAVLNRAKVILEALENSSAQIDAELAAGDAAVGRKRGLLVRRAKKSSGADNGGGEIDELLPFQPKLF
ncbi:MAG: DNA mismatch repair protein MutS [Victivallaceae bacterium]|nr:DNA mismatch repair protein MutS [Victivallaceae bacterium]